MLQFDFTQPLENLVELAEKNRGKQPFVMVNPAKVLEEITPKLKEFFEEQNKGVDDIWERIDVSKKIIGTPDPKPDVLAYVHHTKSNTHIAVFDANSFSFYVVELGYYHDFRRGGNNELEVLTQSLARALPEHYKKRPNSERGEFSLFKVPATKVKMEDINYSFPFAL